MAYEVYEGVLLAVIYERRHIRLRPEEGERLGIHLRVRCSRKFRMGLSVGDRIRMDVGLVKPQRIKPYLVILRESYLMRGQLDLFVNPV